MCICQSVHLSGLCPTVTASPLLLPAPGIPDDVIEKGRNFRIVTEVEQNGNEFTWSQVYPSKTMTNKFTIDQESEMETMAGKKFKATVTMEGGKITVRFPKYHHTAEISGGKLVEVRERAHTCRLTHTDTKRHIDTFEHCAEIDLLKGCRNTSYEPQAYRQCGTHFLLPTRLTISPPAPPPSPPL
ncbi:FABP6 protein, partial [Amia calva]|nr:FABP6 protein [Amia calva]